MSYYCAQRDVGEWPSIVERLEAFETRLIHGTKNFLSPVYFLLAQSKKKPPYSLIVFKHNSSYDHTQNNTFSATTTKLHGGRGWPQLWQKRHQKRDNFYDFACWRKFCN